MTIAALPHLNALLNGITAILLIVGLILIRSGNRQWHRVAMLSAAAVAAGFLVSYLTYHANAPIFKFAGQGGVRTFYYTMLISHVVAAAVNVPMVLIVLYFALSGRFARHKPLARWILPLWLYVSVTGIGVYYMLYHYEIA